MAAGAVRIGLDLELAEVDVSVARGTTPGRVPENSNPRAYELWTHGDISLHVTMIALCIRVSSDQGKANATFVIEVSDGEGLGSFSMTGRAIPGVELPCELISVRI